MSFGTMVQIAEAAASAEIHSMVKDTQLDFFLCQCPIVKVDRRAALRSETTTGVGQQQQQLQCNSTCRCGEGGGGVAGEGRLNKKALHRCGDSSADVGYLTGDSSPDGSGSVTEGTPNSFKLPDPGNSDGDERSNYGGAGFPMLAHDVAGW
jgi:hypothetical protein